MARTQLPQRVSQTYIDRLSRCKEPGGVEARELDGPTTSLGNVRCAILHRGYSNRERDREVEGGGGGQGVIEGDSVEVVCKAVADAAECSMIAR